MGKIIYTNIFASKIHYPVIDYLLNIKKFYEPEDKLILCFWDYEIYTFQVFSKNTQAHQNIKVKEIVNELSRLLNSLNINHQFIYLSDSLKRINNNSNIYDLLLTCYTYISMGKIQDTYNNNKYLKLRPTTLGKLNFMVTDYLIALFFKELYPNIAKNKNVSIYHTGERFIGIKDSIEKAIAQFELIINFPKIKYWKTLPILNYSKGNWISASMSYNEIVSIIETKLPNNIESIKDLICIGLKLDDNTLNYTINSLIKELDKGKINKDILIFEVAKILEMYFNKIKELIEQSQSANIKKITYINNNKEFAKILESINPAKMSILKYCNGKNTIDDIIKLVNMKESSIRSYISRMKKEKLINNSKKPIRLVDEIIINFE